MRHGLLYRIFPTLTLQIINLYSVKQCQKLEFGGSGEIRTHGGLTPSSVFKTGALNRSATLPWATSYKHSIYLANTFLQKSHQVAKIKTKSFSSLNFQVCHNELN